MTDHPSRHRPAGCGMAAALLALLAAGSASAESTPEGTSVLSVRAGSACLTEQVRITGFALAHEESGTSIPFEGYRISEILVSEGDAVTAGQELVRAVRLGGSEAGGQPRPPSPLGPTPGAQAAAMAQMPSVYSARAPIAGRVTRINVRVGMATGQPAAPAAPGMPPEPQVRIMSESGIDLLVDVPSLYATKIRAGLSGRIVSDDGQDVTGTVRVPVSEVDPVTQIGRARLSVDPATALRPGQFASVVIETARDCGLTVPRSAVTYRGGGATVQVLNGTTVETRSVRTGLFDDGTVRIVEGLRDGEPVVANAGTALRAGDRVTPVISDRKGGTSR